MKEIGVSEGYECK